jgi:ribosomal protein L16 Arg81 hydroxylase
MTNQLDLSTFIHPTEVETFRRDYWLEQLFCRHGEPDRLAPLLAQPELASPAALVRSEHKALRVIDTAGMPAMVDREQALAQLSSGTMRTLTVIRAELGIPLLRDLLRRLWRQLRTPQIDVWCNVYYSQKGHGIQPHYDDHETFIVMLWGRKTFTIAPNWDVRFPVGSRNLDPTAWDGDGRPVDAEEHDLEPGSVLVLPRGYWHRSLATEDALSVTLAFRSAPWMRLVLPELRRRLMQIEDWRRPPKDLTSPVELARLLTSLADEIRGQDPKELLTRMALTDLRNERTLGRRTDGDS